MEWLNSWPIASVKTCLGTYNIFFHDINSYDRKKAEEYAEKMALNHARISNDDYVFIFKYFYKKI